MNSLPMKSPGDYMPPMHPRIGKFHCAVAIPKTEKDIETLIRFASENKTSIIPRTAGTSLAGQVVGGGIVVDVSKNFNQIIEVNAAEGWAMVSTRNCQG